VTSPVCYQQGRPLCTFACASSNATKPGWHMPGAAAAGVDGVSIDDVAIQNTVAMLPPSPGNTLADFLAGVVSGDIEPAMCHSSEARLDPTRYWEKRRVQNSLRRLLEALQECVAADIEMPVGDLSAKAFDQALQMAPSVGRMDAAMTSSLDEGAFNRALEALGAWPPELSAADRCEVFAALRTPSVAAVRALSKGQPLPAELTRRMFCESLARVPFNLPDFPVPTHLLRSSGNIGVLDVAEAVATAFCMEPTGLEHVKDFFLCGLLSLEEIQAALPFHAAERLVEEAVSRIIRAGAEHFTMREWQSLVIAARTSPPPEAGMADIVEEELPQASAPSCEQLPCLSSPAPQYRQVPAAPPVQVQAPVLATFQPMQGDGASPLAAATSLASAEDRKVFEAAQQGAPSRPQPTPVSHVPMTEPLPCRQPRSEDPVRFRMGQGQHVINWSTTPWGRSSAGMDNGHQADQGAGFLAGQQQQPQQQQGLSLTVSPANRSRAGSEDAVRLISMDMHNECLGPFLALAFVRCCQLYEVRAGER